LVVPANYNCPGQLVISGSNEGIDIACEKLTEAGARRAIKLPVGGAFHSPLMEPARSELEQAINETNFAEGICPIYQNVTATAITNPEEIKENLKNQLTTSVLWTQTMQQMIADGLSTVTEVGPGKALQGLFKKVDRKLDTQSAGL
jgi:[acyl-carrier-protein] S-malonyltransferase